MIRLVLFDIDGTLIRTRGAGVKAFERVGETLFRVRNGTATLSFAGRTDPAIVRDFFRLHGIEPSPGNFERFFHSYVFWLDHLLGQHVGQVLPGVRELIGGLQQMAPPPMIGLLTGNILLGAQIKLRHFNLWDEFVTGAFGDDDEDRNRLATIALERGSRALGARLRGTEVLVVGDTPRDVACGRAIDSKVLAVATGGASYRELERERPDWLVNSLEEVQVAEICA